MKKTHKAYLRRIIGLAATETKRASISEEVMNVKSTDSEIHSMMRDIVCDARFYSVIENDRFWRDYGTDSIAGFIDSLTSEEDTQEEARTLRKEEFLNDWLARHIIPLSVTEKIEIERNIQLKILEEDSKGIPDPGDSDGTGLGEINLGDGIKDKTQSRGVPADGLPPRLKDYMNDMAGGNTSWLINYGHKAEARFLSNIDPTITALAEKIGRRSFGISEKRGRFKHATKSDITGVTVGDDLNSLLPSEIALLASPSSEQIFFDRFSKKRLQIFSSASSSEKGEDEKGGPIFICIDTSGSMTGEPEELAKTIALAISIIAQKEKRTVCILNYSGSISFFVLRNLQQQRMRLLRFLSDSYGGGNDENKLFRFLLERMPRTKSYRTFAQDLKGADMLVISDFLWDRISEENSTLINQSRKQGMKIYSIGIGFNRSYKTNLNIEKREEYRSGFQFFDRSDFRYVYEERRLKEILNEQ